MDQQLIREVIHITHQERTSQVYELRHNFLIFMTICLLRRHLMAHRNHCEEGRSGGRNVNKLVNECYNLMNLYNLLRLFVVYTDVVVVSFSSTA